MIQIDLSKALAKPLARHLKPARILDPDLYWRADVAMIGAQACIVAQEQYSQYVMVMCGLESDDFGDFPQLFRERFFREVAAICKQAQLYDNQTLATQLAALCEEQHYQLDPEPLEEGPITKVFETLERRSLYERQPLPCDGKSAFEFSFPINSRQSRSDRANDKPSAAEAIGNLCLNLIERRLEGEKAGERPVVQSTVDNIVRVDFARQRNR